MLNAKLKGWLFAALSSSLSSVAWSQIVQLDSVVAIVDEDIILASEVRERVEQVKATAAQRNMTLPDDETVVQETLDRLILESIQLQLADRYGVRVPDAQLDQSMARIAAQNRLTLEQFRDALIQNGQNYVEMREGLRDELAIQRVQQGSVMRDINITEKEIDNFMATEEGIALTEPEYRVVQALLPIPRSDSAELRTAKEDYVDGVHANILAGADFSEAGLRDELAIQRVQQGSVMRDINITEKEIDNFMATEEGIALTEPEYRVVQALLPIPRSDSAELRTAKEDYVDGVLANILAGADFSEAVSVQEPYTFQGGDLGWRKLSDIPSMFADILPSLNAGDTGKVQSNSGLHLVHLAEARGLERLVEQTNVRHILVTPNEVLDDEAARNFVLGLKERVNSGEDFADLAAEHSDDIGSAQEGGELGWTNPGQMVPEFEAAMASAEIGVVTEPVRSEFGWHILEVTGRRTENFAEQVRRNQIANYLREAKYEEELENWLREIRDEAFVDIK